MSSNLNVNQISSSNAWAGVDVANIGSVSSQILSRAQNKTIDLNNIDLTKFQRASQGVDLYSQRVNLDIQRQVSMINAGLVNSAKIDTSYINSQAAATLYGNNVTKNVEGKMTINVPEGEKDTPREVFPLPKSTEVFSTANLAKDRKGSNPFATQESVKNEDNQKGLDILS